MSFGVVSDYVENEVTVAPFLLLTTHHTSNHSLRGAIPGTHNFYCIFLREEGGVMSLLMNEVFEMSNCRMAAASPAVSCACPSV